MEREGCSLKKMTFAVCAWMVAMALIVSGCSLFNLGGAEVMDFDAKMELKAPNLVPGETPKILFVGNSHTFTNDLPGTFYALAAELGYEADVYNLTEGYYTLENFADPEDELGSVLDLTLSSEPWDFVVLQENTSNAVSPTADETMFPYARPLDEKVKRAGDKLLFDDLEP